jgi:hypothetical protein
MTGRKQTPYQYSHHVHMGPIGNREAERYIREMVNEDEERGLWEAEEDGPPAQIDSKE